CQGVAAEGKRHGLAGQRLGFAVEQCLGGARRMVSAPLRLAGGIAGLTLHELAPGGAVHLKMQVGFRHRYLLVYSSVQKASGQLVAIIAIVIRGVKIPSAAASSSPPSFPAISRAARAATRSKRRRQAEARPGERGCRRHYPLEGTAHAPIRLDDGRRRLEAECAAHLHPTLAYASASSVQRRFSPPDRRRRRGGTRVPRRA